MLDAPQFHTAAEQSAEDPGFGIYIHWPFCLSKCPYCDFNSHVRANVDHAQWRAALLRELRTQRERFGAQRVSSVFFGGGTPSLMAPETVASLIDAIAADFTCAGDIEITLEANSTSVEAEKFAQFRAAGVNRVSIGVQALDDSSLRALGRRHSANEALAAIDIARKAFSRVSFDLIYARPDQTVAQWQAELRVALALAPEHLSLYQLTFEPGTPMGDLHARGRLNGPPEDEAAALYEITASLCAEAGLPAYEISNHAKPGAECRHNLVYWRYGDYIGVGPGAHGRVGGMATVNARAPEDWRARVNADGHGLETAEPLSDTVRGEEYLLMGLRLTEGISLSRYRALSGTALDSARLRPLVSSGFLTCTDDRVAATPAGRLVLNRVIAELAA